MTQAKNQQEIISWEDIPEFETEEEEQAFWDNHCLGDDILKQMKPVKESHPKSESYCLGESEET